MTLRLKRRVLIIMLTLTGCVPLRAQSYYFSHYQVENGLSNNAVICSLQDHQGFLWFGTKDGLNRFDGYSFKVFRHDPDDSLSIGSNFIYCLYEDKAGVLWVGCDRGLFQYNATAESFTPVLKTPANEILDIQMDAGGNLWFIARMRLFRYDFATGTRKLYHPSINVTSVCTASDGSLWISTAAGLLEKFNPATDSFTSFDVFNKSKPAISRWVEKIFDAGNGFLLVGTSKDGAKIFDTRTCTYKDILTYDTDNTEVFVRDFIQLSPEEYWIASESGIFIYNVKSGKLLNLKKNYSDPYSLSDNAVYTLCRDKEGGIWAGTYFGGINHYAKQYTYFRKYFPQYGSNSISGNAVREIHQDGDGNLWIGTEDAGLNKLESATRTFIHFNPYNAQYRVSHSNIHGLLINGRELWVGTFHHGLDVLDVRTGRLLRHYSAAVHSLKSDFVYCLCRTRSGRIIAGTDRGLCEYNAKSDNFKPITDVPSTFYTALYEDREGTIWAGTYSEGLHYFNPASKQKGSFKYQSGNKSSLSSNRVNWITEDSRGRLWVATEGGLGKLDRAKGSFLNYTAQSGLPSNIVYAILEDGKGNLWISTSKGLARFNPETKKIRIYTKANGLLSDQFNYNAAYRDATGRMYFGSVKGLISFHPDEFQENSFIPPVYITGFQVYDKELDINRNGSPLEKSITYTQTITLRHNQSSFSIDFAALSYTAPEMTEYTYKLEGLDKDWTYLKTNRKAYFTELAPGTYIFKVKASVSSGVWSNQPALLTIKILPPFWKSAWAYFLYVAFAVAIIYFLVRSYHRRHEEKNKRQLEILKLEKEKELYQSKIDFFTSVAHEIRTPLTLIKGPMEKIMKKADEVPAIRNSLQIMQRNTDRLLDLTTQLLDFRKIEINGFHLNFSEADIAEILRENYLRFKPVARQKKLRFELYAITPLIASVDTEALNKIISNLLNNAIKYAASKVFIQLLPPLEGEKYFAIEVKSDGYLIPREMKEKIFETFFRLKETKAISGTGIGLALSRSLAELHKGSLQLKEPENDLNVFALTLPVQQETKLDSSQQNDRS